MTITKIAEVPDIDAPRMKARVVAHHQLSDTGYELILERNHLSFDAGRLLTLHGRTVTEDRSYTIASGEQDEHLHILYRLVPTGVLTPQLVTLRAGDTVECSGPYGQFVLRDAQRPICFIATGTGVAPCRAYVRTHPNLNLTLIHGVREPKDLFFREEFERFNYKPCCSVAEGAHFNGRVTHYLDAHPPTPDADYYLCGAYEMIYDVQARLVTAGVDPARIFTEGYYYRMET